MDQSQGQCLWACGPAARTRWYCLSTRACHTDYSPFTWRRRTSSDQQPTASCFLIIRSFPKTRGCQEPRAAFADHDPPNQRGLACIPRSPLYAALCEPQLPVQLEVLFSLCPRRHIDTVVVSVIWPSILLPTALVCLLAWKGKLKDGQGSCRFPAKVAGMTIVSAFIYTGIGKIPWVVCF